MVSNGGRMSAFAVANRGKADMAIALQNVRLLVSFDAANGTAGSALRLFG